MPANTVAINESRNYEWYVADSKIRKVIKCLCKNGYKYNTETDEYDKVKAEDVKE